MADKKLKIPTPDFSQHTDYPHHVQPELPKHFSMLSAQTGPEHHEENHQKLKQDLHHAGFNPIHLSGNYGYDEKSFMVRHEGTPEQKQKLEELAWKYNQHSILHSSEMKHELVFQDKSPSWKGEGMIHGPFLKEFSSVLPSGHKIRLAIHEPEAPKEDPKPEIKKADYLDNIESHYKKKTKQASPHYYGFMDGVHFFHALHEDHDELLGRHVSDPKDLPKAISEAKESPHRSVIVHGVVPSELRQQAFSAPHPHSYEWDDESIEKSDDKKEDLYDSSSSFWGRVHDKKKTNHHFYEGIEGLEHKINDIGNKDSHKDVESPYVRSWRKLHDAAHEQTKDEVNSMYGDGKRKGKIGKELSPHEAKRAVHWEWLAVHKQRELSDKIGHPIKDEDFAREANTVVHDAVHRVISGKHVEPSERGFEPHPHLVPIERALSVIDEHAEKEGIKHQNEKNPDKTPENSSISIKPEGSLKKAFLQGDGETKTDSPTFATALSSLPKDLMQWGVENLVPMKKDDPISLELKGRIIKLRKLMEDLYSGWIEEKGQKIHAFERVTMPELLQQIQSKLELYSSEDKIVEKDKEISMPAKELIEEHENLINVLESPDRKEHLKEAQEQKKELAEYKKEAQDDAEDIKKLDLIDKKLKELQNKIKTMIGKEGKPQEVIETLSGKELVQGIENPQKDCPACERPVDKCVCYTGLPSPRVEFDMDKKKLYIFFKSEWQEDDRENFKKDMVSRVGRLLNEKRLVKAKDVLNDLKKRINK